MNSMVAQYAEVLGITGNVTHAAVRAAYRQQMLIWHPDRHHGEDSAELALTKAQAINEAYEFLSEIVAEQPIADVASPTAAVHNDYRTQHTYQNRNFRPGFPDPAVFEVFVKSSWIVSGGYDLRSRTLYIKLDRGDIYRCFDVPGSVFDEFCQADSVGRFVNQRIFSTYRHEVC